MMTVKAILFCALCFLVDTRVSSQGVKIEKVAAPVELGEGPFWDIKSQKLYYVDLLKGHKLLRYDPATGDRTTATLDAQFVGLVVPVAGTINKLIAGVDSSVVIVTWDGKKNVANAPMKKLASLDTDRDDTRVNDGKCDAAGRLWIGTMAINKGPNRGSLYKIEKNGTAVNVVSPISIGNGLTWSLKNDIMYYIDSPTRQIWAFDYDIADGKLSNKRVVFDLNGTELGGIPDGMTNDADGNLWVALFGGKAVIQIDPKEGKLLRRVELPDDNVTCPIFGGPQLQDLYVTTARDGLTDEEKRQQPGAGALYRITGLGVRGVPPHECNYNPRSVKN